MRRRELRQMARREQRVGSRLGALYAELCLAWADLQLGRPDLADDFFGTDPVEVVYEPFLDALYHSVYADWHRLSQRPLAALGAIREVRGARISELSEDADMLLSLAEARTLIALEEHVAAEQVLARTVGSRGALAHQGRILALAARLQSPGDELEYAAWRVLRQLPCAWLDPVEASTVLKQAADALLECGRITAAQGTLGASRAIASALLRDALEEDVAMLRHALGVQATPPKPLPRAQP